MGLQTMLKKDLERPVLVYMRAENRYFMVFQQRGDAEIWAAEHLGHNVRPGLLQEWHVGADGAADDDRLIFYAQEFFYPGN